MTWVCFASDNSEQLKANEAREYSNVRWVRVSIRFFADQFGFEFEFGWMCVGVSVLSGIVLFRTFFLFFLYPFIDLRLTLTVTRSLRRSVREREGEITETIELNQTEGTFLVTHTSYVCTRKGTLCVSIYMNTHIRSLYNCTVLSLAISRLTYTRRCLLLTLDRSPTMVF